MRVKLFKLDRDVYGGQCKNTLMRIQYKYNSLSIGIGLIPRGWVGTRIGIFTPIKKEGNPDYVCKGFYFYPHLYPDVSVGKMAKWYRKLTNLISYRNY